MLCFWCCEKRKIWISCLWYLVYTCVIKYVRTFISLIFEEMFMLASHPFIFYLLLVGSQNSWKFFSFLRKIWTSQLLLTSVFDHVSFIIKTKISTLDPFSIEMKLFCGFFYFLIFCVKQKLFKIGSLAIYLSIFRWNFPAKQI